MRMVADNHMHFLREVPIQNTIQSFQKSFVINGIEKAVFLCIPTDCEGHDNDRMQNLKGLFLKAYFAPDAYAFAGLIHPDGLDLPAREQDFERQVTEYVSAGFDGIKMLEGKPNLRRWYGLTLSDPSYDRMYQYLEDHGIPLVMHNADPAEFWDKNRISPYAITRGWYNDPEENLTWEEMYQDVLQVMAKHPKLHLTLAHFGFTSERRDLAERFLGEYPNTMFDLTPGGEQMLKVGETWDKWKDFFEIYRNRIKFGTDTYNEWGGTPEEWEINVRRRNRFLREFLETSERHEYNGTEFTGIGIDEDILSHIYRENLIREYGNPKPIRTEWIHEEIEVCRTLYASDEMRISDLCFMEEWLRQSPAPEALCSR